VREWLSCTHSFPIPWLRSHSHSRPWEILDYIPIPILFPKSNPDSLPFPLALKQEEFKNSYRGLVIHGEEWFSLEWAHKIIHYNSTLVSHSTRTLMKWKWHARVKANVKLKWLCFPSSRITEQILIWYWKAEIEIHSHSHSSIPIPILLFPLPFLFPWYSHCHSHSRGNPVGPMGLFPFPCTSPLLQYWLLSYSISSYRECWRKRDQTLIRADSPWGWRCQCTRYMMTTYRPKVI